MMRIGRSLLLSAGLWAGIAGLGLAEESLYRAKNGAELPMPAIDLLGCGQMQELMHLYSASGYRLPGVVPVSQPDATLFAYEDSLAKLHYEKCHLGQNDFSGATDSFGKGFN